MASEQTRELVTYHLDPDETVAEGVINSTSDLYDAEPTDLDPLYDAIDPDALDALFRPDSEHDVEIAFRYNGCEVAVSSERVVETRPVD